MFNRKYTEELKNKDKATWTVINKCYDIKDDFEGQSDKKVTNKVPSTILNLKFIFGQINSTYYFFWVHQPYNEWCSYAFL